MKMEGLREKAPKLTRMFRRNLLLNKFVLSFSANITALLMLNEMKKCCFGDAGSRSYRIRGSSYCRLAILISVRSCRAGLKNH